MHDGVRAAVDVIVRSFGEGRTDDCFSRSEPEARFVFYARPISTNDGTQTPHERETIALRRRPDDAWLAVHGRLSPAGSASPG
jgi:hypothetical protein